MQIKFRSLLLLLAINFAHTATSQSPQGYLRIIGGNNQYSSLLIGHVVSVQVKKQHVCSGSIISDYWVLTAARCVIKMNFEIVAGTRDLRDRAHATIFTPAQVVVHCSYRYLRSAHNIGLVRTNEQIIFTRYVKYIRLANEVTYSGDGIHFTGWGATYAAGKYADVLQILFVKSVSPCVTSDYKLDLATICTRNYPNKSGCTRDSGSGLVYNGELIGVAGHQMSCCSGKPDVFASVPHYYDFIRSTINTCNVFPEPKHIQ